LKISKVGLTAIRARRALISISLSLTIIP